MKYLAISAALVLAACAANSAGWSASTWSGLPDRTVAGGGYSFFASPAEGQGFKLKFSVKTDGTFGVAEAPTEDALVEAARAAISCLWSAARMAAQWPTMIAAEPRTRVPAG